MRLYKNIFERKEKVMENVKSEEKIFDFTNYEVKKIIEKVNLSNIVYTNKLQGYSDSYFEDM